jgi:hypothetical protein
MRPRKPPSLEDCRRALDEWEAMTPSQQEANGELLRRAVDMTLALAKGELGAARCQAEVLHVVATKWRVLRGGKA